MVEVRSEPIEAEQVLAALQRPTPERAWMDARSESEFAKGSIPGFVNLPILDDAQRHQVGIEYRRHGQQAAIELGHRLVDRQQRVRSWLEHIGSRETIVGCWRGGLRSEIACQWLQSAGVTTRRVVGGYKALRGSLLRRLQDLPKITVLSGLTGSGKTQLINELAALGSDLGLDLEGLAQHRGSSFGAMETPQPAQATFENQILLRIHPTGQLLVEDESAKVGRLLIPATFYSSMKQADSVWVEADLPSRTRRIFEEYVATPLETNSVDRVAERLARNLAYLKRHLGGERYQSLNDALSKAFAAGQHYEQHARWIADLLQSYYDPRYQYASERHPRKLVFQGDYQACLHWIQQNLV